MNLLETYLQIEAFKVAAQLTAAVTCNFPDTLTVDPNITAEDLRTQNLAAWEVFKVFNAAISKAVNDPSWPRPKVDAAADLAGIAEAVIPALAGQGALGARLAPLIPVVLGLLKRPAPAPAVTPSSTPIPSPGEAVTPAPAKP